MANQIVCSLAFLFLFLFGAHAATFTVRNNGRETIWPATLTSGPGQPQLSTTGFELAPGASRSFNVPAPWTGRVWARTRCSNNGGRFTCLTGDCGRGLSCNGAGGVPPVTLAEFTLAPNGGQDFYDVSLVDGFNIQATITTQGGTGPCRSSNCRANVNSVCPNELQVRAPNGEVIACKSACLAFGEDRYCCTGAFNNPNVCRPTNYSEIFERQCPEAYSYAYDDKNSTFTCNNLPNYTITFV
ncbi:thaumatin family protein [Salmonella sp. NW173]|uniref:thaumatin family protein n=1 Tax=Salmonella sp. NW173 TaxID=2947771 RepID=UPI003F6B99D6